MAFTPTMARTSRAVLPNRPPAPRRPKLNVEICQCLAIQSKTKRPDLRRKPRDPFPTSIALWT